MIWDDGVLIRLTWEWVKTSSFFWGEWTLHRPPAAVKQHRSLPTEFHTPKQSQLAQQSLFAIRVAIQQIERTKVGSISSTIHNSNNFRDGFNIAIDYPLVNVYITNWKITMLFMGKSTISMAIFNSYVKLPEGKACVLDVQRRCFLLRKWRGIKKKLDSGGPHYPQISVPQKISFINYIYTQGIYMLNDSYPSKYIYIYIIYIIYCIL